MAGLRDLEPVPGLVLPAHLLSVRTARSGGPGGQHVNKAETKVDLRLDLAGAGSILGEEALARVRARLRRRLDARGDLQVVSAEHRSQTRNLEAALARMETLLRAALAKGKKRRRTRPTQASRRRRLDAKRHRGRIKRWRSDRGEDA